MRTLILAFSGFLTGLLPLGLATHTQGCVPTSADPSTYNVIDLTDVGGNLYYLEERAVPPPFNASPPIPGTGWLLGEKTWLYEEANAIPGLQRGGINIAGACLPPSPAPCLIIDEDWIQDKNCGHGPDAIVL